jgi:hypothetical protein
VLFEGFRGSETIPSGVRGYALAAVRVVLVGWRLGGVVVTAASR